MDRELDNANPTIFAPTASGSRRQKAPKALLWSEEAEEYTYSDHSSEEEEREDIDADEVFGESAYHHVQQSPFRWLDWSQEIPFIRWENTPRAFTHVETVS
jgi:hypothetical protein